MSSLRNELHLKFFDVLSYCWANYDSDHFLVSARYRRKIANNGSSRLTPAIRLGTKKLQNEEMAKKYDVGINLVDIEPALGSPDVE